MSIYILISGLVILNLLVSACVLKDTQRRRNEKFAEAAVIWLLPIFGALMSLCVSCRDPQREKQVEEIEQELHSLR